MSHRGKSGVRAFAEVTGFAIMLFVVPIGYYYGREDILNIQNRIYYSMFGLRQEHLQQFKQKLAEQNNQEKEMEEKFQKEKLELDQKKE